MVYQEMFGQVLSTSKKMVNKWQKMVKDGKERDEEADK
jgi:hypothetical protein